MGSVRLVGVGALNALSAPSPIYSALTEAEGSRGERYASMIGRREWLRRAASRIVDRVVKVGRGRWDAPSVQ
jgi:hypothetical protein